MSIEIAEAAPPAEGHQSAELEDFLLALLRLASVLNESAIFADHGIGLAEWAMLKDVGADPIRLADLSRRMRLSRQRVRVLIKELQRKHLLRVTESTDGDRRGRTIAATESAIEALRAITEKLNALDLPAKGRGLPRAARLTQLLLRTLRQTKKRQGSIAASAVAAPAGS